MLECGTLRTAGVSPNGGVYAPERRSTASVVNGPCAPWRALWNDCNWDDFCRKVAGDLSSYVVVINPILIGVAVPRAQARKSCEVCRRLVITQEIRMSILRYPLHRAALAVITACACSPSSLSIAQAHGTDNPPAKRHIHRAPYFSHLSGPAEAWVNGRCDRPLQSEFPPCIYPTFPGSPYFYDGWHPGPRN